MKANKCISNYEGGGGGLHTLSNMEMCYKLIPLRGIDIVNPIIQSKPMSHARFVSTMIKYSFTKTASQSGGEGQVYTHTYDKTYRYTFPIVQAGRSSVIEITHPIILGFS